MQNKINFQNQTVQLNTKISFEEMATLEAVLNEASLSAFTEGNAKLTSDIHLLSDRLGIDIDMGQEVKPEAASEAE